VINTLALRQARDMIQGIIDESPVSVIVYRDVFIDNGFDRLVADPFHVGAPQNLRGRISHEKKAVEAVATTSAGLSTALSRYFLTNHKTEIREGEVFEAIGKRWRIGPVDVLRKFGGIVGYQAPLVEAAEVPEVAT